MAIAITHGTAADGTFSASGATAWNASHSLSGLTANALLYSTDATTLAQNGPLWGPTAGQGLQIPAGTATTDVAALSITRTNNNAAVATGVKWTFTDTTSAAGFLAFQILGGASATTNLFKVDKAGNSSTGMLEVTGTGSAPASAGIYGSGSGATNVLWLAANGGAKWSVNAGGAFVEVNGDLSMSRITTNVLGVGTGAAGNSAGSIRCKHQSSDGTAGVTSFGPSAVTSITVKDGIITAIS